MKTGNKAFTGAEVLGVLAVIALLTGGAFAFKPSWFGGASKRAQNSTQSTAALVKATDAQGSAAAASVAKIGEANSAAPASPSKDFITSEVPVALSRLPAPDAQALIEAERRRSAVMEGRADEARRLYEQAAKKSEQLQAERDEALAARQAADLALERSAAAEHARTMQAFGAGFVAVIGFGLFIWAKAGGYNIRTMGKMAASIRAGDDPIEVIDRFTAERHHEAIHREAKLASRLADRPAASK